MNDCKSSVTRRIGLGLIAVLLFASIASQYLISILPASWDEFIFVLVGLVFAQPVVLAVWLVFGAGQFFWRALLLTIVVAVYLLVCNLAAQFSGIRFEDVLGANFYSSYEMVFHVPFVTAVAVVPLAILKFYRGVYLVDTLQASNYEEDYLSIKNLLVLTALMALIVVSTQSHIQNNVFFDNKQLRTGMLTSSAIAVIAGLLFSVVARLLLRDRGFWLWTVVIIGTTIALWTGGFLMLQQLDLRIPSTGRPVFYLSLPHMIYHGISVLTTTVVTCLFLGAMNMAGIRLQQRAVA